MPTAKLFHANAEPAGTVELDAEIFGQKPDPSLIEQAIVIQLGNRRQPIAHTKTKGEVRGGGRKPWRQKGTGRARHGSIRSPQWKGGGVVHGPRSNANFKRKLNQKTRHLAVRMALSDRAQRDRVAVIEKMELPEAKTKKMAAILKSISAAKRHLIILAASQPLIVRAARNLPGLTIIRADSLNVYDLIKSPQLIIEQSALPIIKKVFNK